MELQEIREHLDRIDDALFVILAERMSFINKVSEYKIKNNIARFQPEREKKIIEKKREIAEKYWLNPDLAEDVIKVIIKDSHRIQKEMIWK